MTKSAKTAKPAAAPVMTSVERVGFEASVALEKDNAFMRGWRAGSDPAVKAQIAAYNQQEQARCVAAALALLKL